MEYPFHPIEIQIQLKIFDLYRVYLAQRFMEDVLWADGPSAGFDGFLCHLGRHR